jgi:hypothetical protein
MEHCQLCCVNSCSDAVSTLTLRQACKRCGGEGWFGLYRDGKYLQVNIYVSNYIAGQHGRFLCTALS